MTDDDSIRPLCFNLMRGTVIVLGMATTFATVHHIGDGFGAPEYFVQADDGAAGARIQATEMTSASSTAVISLSPRGFPLERG